MSRLAELQRDFQNHVMHGSEQIAVAVTDTPQAPAAVRLGIYSEAYRLRLIDALASTLPRLQQLLGQDRFAALAGDYIDRHPSQYRSIRWFGDRVSALLAEFAPDQPWYAELAAWEWNIASAFDAADDQPVGVEALAAIDPERWPTLQFTLHPSVQLVHMRTNAPSLFKALTEDAPVPAGLMLNTPQPWLIWREQLTTQYRSLGADEAAALEAIRSGGTFETLCDTLCNWHDAESVPLQAAGMLKRWVIELMITAVRSAD